MYKGPEVGLRRPGGQSRVRDAGKEETRQGGCRVGLSWDFDERQTTKYSPSFTLGLNCRFPTGICSNLIKT